MTRSESPVTASVNLYSRRILKETSHYSTIKTDSYAKLILVITDVTTLYNNVSRHDGTEACLKLFQGKQVSISAQTRCKVIWLTLTINNFTQNPTNYARRSYDSILKEVNPPSTLFPHAYSYSPLTLLNLSQLQLLPPTPNPSRFHSLSFALSLCPIGLSNHTVLQKEKSTNKPTNGLSVNCLLYCRNKLTSVGKCLCLLIVAATSLLLKD